MTELSASDGVLQRLPRRYELIEVLGESPRSIIVRARDASLERDVALKIHKRDDVGREEALRFRREFGVLASLAHPNIVRVFDFGVLEGGWPYFTMELVRGRTITEAFDGRDWAGLTDLMLQIVSGLHHIHGAGMVHLDIKPSNILVDDAHRARIMDFGLAVQNEQLHERRIRGTLHYMAPEVLRQDRIDFRADHYALGMTLYEVATGAHPAAGLPVHEVIALHLEGQVRRPGLLNSSMPPGIDRVIARMLERDPRHRYPSTTALLHDVARLAGLEQPREELVRERPDLLVPPLIGRQHAAACIDAAIERARRGEGGGILVAGEEGIGKSRTVQEAVLRAQLTGARVFHGRCPVNGKSVYAPFYEIFQQIVRTMHPEADPAREVRRIVRGAAAPGSDGEKFRLFNRVAQSIQDFYGFLNVVGTTGSPMILVIEDLQWADRATLELLTFLVGEARSSYLLLVGILAESPGTGDLDDAPADEWVVRASEAGMEIVELAALTEADVQELLTALLGAETLPLDLVRWITWESAGNPARVRALLTLLIERQLLLWENGEWRADMQEIQGLRFPGGVAAAWAERVERLPLGDLTILQIASVFGEQFDIDEVAAIAGVSADDVYATMQRMALDELIASVGGDGQFRFPQASARDAVYGSLPDSTRTDLHRRAADLLEAEWKRGVIDRIGQLAYHCARGAEYARGIEYSLAAGEQAAAALVPEQAAEFYGTALELMDLAGEEERKFEVRERLGDSYFRANHLRHAIGVYQFLLKTLEGRNHGEEHARDSARLLRKIGRVQARRGEYEAAIETFDRAGSIMADLGDRGAWAELLSRRAASLQRLGRLDQAEAAAREAAALVQGEPDAALNGYLEQTLGNLALARNDREEALERFRNAASIAVRANAPAVARAATAALADLLWKMGRGDEALGHFRSNLEAAERDGDLWDLVHAYVDVARIESENGDWHTAAELLERSISIDQRLGLSEHEAIGQLHLGAVLERIGRWKDARARLERSIKIEGFDETRPVRVSAYLPLARIVARTGDTNAGFNLARTAYETARRTHHEELGAEASLTMAEIEAARDNFSEAVRYADESVHLFEARGVRAGAARALCFAADLALRQHSFERGRLLLERAVAISSGLSSAWVAAAVDAIRARVMYVEGDKQHAEELAADLDGRLEALGGMWEIGRLQLEMGLLREDPDDATKALTKAARVFEALEAVHELDRVRGALARIRPSPRKQEPVIGLYEVGKIINSTLDLDEVLHRVLDLALRRLRAARGMIMLIDPITGELRTRAARHLLDDGAPRSPQTVIREVMRTGKALVSANAREDERFNASHSVVADNIVSMLCVPLVIRDRISGAIYVDHQEASHLFTQRDLNFLEAFADQAAIAIDNARLYQEIDEARARLTIENETLRREVLVEKHLDSIIGASDVVARIQFAIRKAAASASTVLVRGESGTGKGLVARIIHNVSARRNGPFINFNCAALPESLAESELFGHERGAFTGADRRKLGRFELANGGTLFLDEIGKVGLAVQAKLLRIVEEKEFERVGGTQTIHTDVKIVAATNLDLERAIADGTFREDLYYRLNIIPIHIPPLRERRSDIPLLVEYFMKKICRELGCDMRRLDPGVLELLLRFDWPGNVRELEATLHRAIVMSAGNALGPGDFLTLIQRPGHPDETEIDPALLVGVTKAVLTPEAYEEAMGRLDRELIQRALDQSNGRIREAARRLGLARNTLKARMQKYGIAGRD